MPTNGGRRVEWQRHQQSQRDYHLWIGAHAILEAERPTELQATARLADNLAANGSLTERGLGTLNREPLGRVLRIDGE